MEVSETEIKCKQCGSSDVEFDAVSFFANGGGVCRCKACERTFVIDLGGRGEDTAECTDSDFFVVKAGKLLGYRGEGVGGVVMPSRTSEGKEDIKSVEEGALRENLGISSFRIASSVASLKSRVFAGCHNLNTVVFPRGLKSMGEECFMLCERLTWVHMPDLVTVIMPRTFAFCTDLSYVMFNVNLSAIGEGAFAGCGNLSEVKFSEPQRGCSYALNEIGKEAFMYCKSVKEIGLPESLKKIGSDAFAYCLSLGEMTIPKGTEEIGERAFAGCMKLKKVVIPASVRKMGPNVFAGCSSDIEITCGVRKCPPGWDKNWLGCGAKPKWVG
ncbi:MAG: leucine-rich repeat domain-containing protein [Bacteroidales bacterium]|nr:leucine-rich repeat domain-containing protein [Bacteroidales bacterium]